MTTYGGKDLAASFRTVRRNTVVAATEIPEDQYGFRPAPDTRTVAEQLVHIASASRIQEQIQKVERRNTLVGFDFMGLFGEVIGEEKKPRTKAEIVSMLEERGEEFAKWLDTLTDDFLAERVEMPAGMAPASKTWLEMLLSVKEHEMHHRAQVMLMQRMIGIVPHGTRAFNERLAQMQKPATAA
jgi:uncharacterized damage-inducible protein DinB